MTSRRKQIVEDVEISANESPEQHEPKPLISTGSTLLNLACSDTPDGGFQMGSMVNLIGDSSSGKTFEVLTLLAEACYNPDFDNYDLIHDDAENRSNFNLNYLFGDKVSERVESAFGYDEDDQPIQSETIEDFQDSVYKRLESGKPFIYILDSMDALDAEGDIEKFEKTMVYREKIREGKKAKEIKGTYGMAKAKANSEILRRICGKLRHTNSLLIIISQTRDLIGLGFAESTRAGGRALKFYCCHEIWLAVAETYKKKELPIGVRVRVRIKKNSLTGKVRETGLSIYYDYGVDDIGSMIDYLVKEKVWIKPDKSSIITTTFEKLKGTKDKIISEIEKNRWERKLKKLVTDQWKKVEDSLKSNRKRKYS